MAGVHNTAGGGAYARDCVRLISALYNNIVGNGQERRPIPSKADTHIIRVSYTLNSIQRGNYNDYFETVRSS